GTLSRSAGENVGNYNILLGSGTKAANYTITFDSTNQAMGITAKPLTISGQVAVNKVYDSGTTATIDISNSALVGALSADAVTLNATGAYGTFVSANAGNGIAVTVGGNVLSGTSANNYSLSQPAGLTANITKATLTVTARADSKFVTQSDNYGFNGATISGFVGGQTSSVLGGYLMINRSNYTQNNAATYNGVLQPSGYISSNYNINYVAGDYTIVPAQTLIIKVANTTTTYGTTAALAPTSVQYLDGSNVLKTLSQTAASGNTYTYSDGVGGSAKFTLSAVGSASSGGALVVGSYNTTGINFSQVSQNFVGSPVYTGTLSVNQKALTASASNISKIYDGSTSMSGLTLGLSTPVSGDDVSVGGVGSFGQSSVGNYVAYNVSNLSLTGTDKANYYLTGGTSFTGSNGTITARPIIITANSNQTKVYGNADPASYTYTPEANSTGRGLVGSDAFTGALTRATGENVNTYAIGQGTLANSNYTISYVPANFAITPRPITLTASSATKIYGETDPSLAVTITAGSLASVAV
ncbi:hypothetical protein ICN46_11885, partial [Polynucleobacter sp. Latsch14-2]|uniref:MBG domain-containing protein n=1 Tax=Polynucleobacter sp. Latsch14-2 TaxID=2576920 RepID=UPI001C0E835D